MNVNDVNLDAVAHGHVPDRAQLTVSLGNAQFRARSKPWRASAPGSPPPRSASIDHIRSDAFLGIRTPLDDVSDHCGVMRRSQESRAEESAPPIPTTSQTTNPWLRARARRAGEPRAQRRAQPPVSIHPDRVVS
jgi:hypothetical protein